MTQQQLCNCLDNECCAALPAGWKCRKEALASKTVMSDARLAVDMREQAESFTDIAGYTLTGRLLRAGADTIERLQQAETKGKRAPMHVAGDRFIQKFKREPTEASDAAWSLPQEPAASRSVQRRVAAMRGEPAPEFGPSEKATDVTPGVCCCRWNESFDAILHRDSTCSVHGDEATQGDEMTNAADIYAKQATAQFCLRVPLTEIQRELLHAMFALAWQSGCGEGGKIMAELVKQEWDAAMKGAGKS